MICGAGGPFVGKPFPKSNYSLLMPFRGGQSPPLNDGSLRLSFADLGRISFELDGSVLSFEFDPLDLV